MYPKSAVPPILASSTPGVWVLWVHHQVKLDDDSNKLCTFSTPWGKYRWKRLLFGLTYKSMISTYSASLTQHGTIMYGSTQTSSSLKTKHLFGGWHEPQMDWELTTSKLTPSPTRLPHRTLLSCRPLWEWLTTWFSPIITHASEPLQQLMKKDTPFVWQPKHHRAFQNVKQIITKTPVLAYYDLVSFAAIIRVVTRHAMLVGRRVAWWVTTLITAAKETNYDPQKDNVIQSHASLKGICCILMQDGKPVCYTSRSLSDTESRHSNIERELLAASWSQRGSTTMFLAKE